MSNLDFIKEKQPIVYQVLDNAISANKLSHAYLFSGVKGSLQNEVANLLVSSLFCENEKWACGVCTICQRIKNNNYSDLIILDGKVSSIKKADITNLIQQFLMTSLEKYNYKVFIIKDADNMTLGAANSLLKFLEEPTPNVLGILISERIESILPTIISRCQVLNFKQLSYLDNFNLAKANSDTLNAYLFSRVAFNYFDVDSYQEESSYQLFVDNFTKFVDNFDSNVEISLLNLHQHLIKLDNKNEVKIAFEMFLNMLIVYFKDVINNNSIDDNWYTNSISRYQSLKSEKILEVLLLTKDKYHNVFNLALLVDQLFYKIKEALNE